MGNARKPTTKIACWRLTLGPQHPAIALLGDGALLGDFFRVDAQAQPSRGHRVFVTVAWYLDNRAWIDGVRSGAYREWVAENYGDR